VIVVVGIVGFYLAERLWLSKKVEEADPERLQEFRARCAGKTAGSQTGVSGAHPFQTTRRVEPKKPLASKRGEADGD